MSAAAFLSQLQRFRDQDRLPHAVMIPTGVLEPVQVWLEIRPWVQRLLCLRPVGDLPCDGCRSCQLFRADAHPDVRLCQGEPQQSIKIEEIRSVRDFLQGKAQLSSHKVVVLMAADEMTAQAANAFLKTLEEPEGCTLILLLVIHPHRLLQTLRSRCVQLRSSSFKSGWQEKDEIAEKIQSDLSRPPSEIWGRLESWNEWPAQKVLRVLWFWVADAIRRRFGSSPEAAMFERGNPFLQAQTPISLDRLWKCLEKLNHTQSLILSGCQLNFQLFLEDTLITCFNEAPHGE